MFAALLLLASGCAVHLPASSPYNNLQVAELETPEAYLLDVGISQFGYHLDADSQAQDPSLSLIRQAESRYMPVMLQHTLMASGSWGEVYVLPDRDHHYDVQVHATILESSGHTLRLQVTVGDASGRRWFDRRYTEHVGENVFGEQSLGVNDPFQGLYNRIANDLLAFRRDHDFSQMRQIADMRFGSRFAPELYQDYLNVDGKGIASLSRLPAPLDPVHARLQEIRVRDKTFHSALQRRYFNYVRLVSENYLQYRRFSYLEDKEQHDQQEAARNNLVSGIFWLGVAAATADYDTVLGSTITALSVLEGVGDISAGIAGLPVESNIQAELAESFANDVSEEVIQLEHEVVILKGNVDAMYLQWQDILQQMFLEDRGKSVAGESNSVR